MEFCIILCLKVSCCITKSNFWLCCSQFFCAFRPSMLSLKVNASQFTDLLQWYLTSESYAVLRLLQCLQWWLLYPSVSLHKSEYKKDGCHVLLIEITFKIALNFVYWRIIFMSHCVYIVARNIQLISSPALLLTDLILLQQYFLMAGCNITADLHLVRSEAWRSLG